MNPIFLLDENIPLKGAHELGGKGSAIQQLVLGGFTVPRAACIPCSVYRYFIESNGLREKILLEINRKDLADTRWEEIWDVALRIRSFFLAAFLPNEIERSIADFVVRHFDNIPLAIRSSAPDEDDQNFSFAGLHESYVNVIGVSDVIEHVKKVWASLWSDRALLYRQELGLQVEKSEMAVIVQQLVIGSSSGIVFTQNPRDDSQMIIESVHGLNQGLVDGEVEPDRWFIDREKNRIVSYKPSSKRDKIAAPTKKGIAVVAFEDERTKTPPIDEKTVLFLTDTAINLENYFKCPQDIEWTLSGQKLYILQSRPITAFQQDGKKDKRPWYLSLHRSFNNLCELRDSIENHFLPQMEQDAVELAAVNLAELSDKDLAQAIEQRVSINSKWDQTYWNEFIPFAHGMRLFGEVYNDLIKPKDPYEFVQLLSGSRMLSTSRNRLLMEIASVVKSNPVLLEHMLNKSFDQIDDPTFLSMYETLHKRFGNPFESDNQHDPTDKHADKKLFAIIVEYAQMSDNITLRQTHESDVLENFFIKKMETSGLFFSGAEILELARASYRLRDDDNIILGKIEKQVAAAVQEGRKRLSNRAISGTIELLPKEVAELLVGKKRSEIRPLQAGKNIRDHQTNIRARQLVGQPASAGIARAKARVIDGNIGLETFKRGEILVVDAIDPNMTFIAPLAAAIVERRGGMLIHGAIIAREYGLPCVTGIPEATKLIHTGDTLTVDGYLGIVTISKSKRGKRAG